ncbi:transglutaminase domain-containing protein [Streptosporangiaceae bacterium NEAU-GS5]|nr:transglutaminase domain-containing protein [Streptosporangiaceae bacterium NEAU-GS5]
MNGRLRTFTVATACSAAAASQSVVYLTYFAEPWAVAALFATGMAAGVAATRKPALAAVSALAVVVCLALAATLVATRLPLPLWPGTAGRGLLYGWIRMLTVGLPADPTAELLATPILVTAVGSFAATRAALRPVAGTALLVIVTTFSFSLAMTASTTAVSAAWMAPILVCGALAIQAHGPFNASPRYLSWVLVMVIAAGSGSLIAGTYGSSHARFDPRRLVVPPPLHIPTPITPLSRVKPQLREEAPRELFTVQVLNGADTLMDRVHIATLIDYDGVTWTIGEPFYVPGARLGLTQPGTPVQARLVMTGLDGPFLPLPGQPEQLRFEPAGPELVEFADEADTAVVDQSSLGGTRYVVTARVASGGESAPSRATLARSTRLPPDLPTLIAKRARELTRGAATPRAQALMLEKALRAMPYSLDAPSGHSYPAIERFLAGGDSPGDGVGFAEQHAAAYVLLARSLGLPSRVAVGYLLRPPVNGIHHVTNRDAHAWPEVYFSGYGWVEFEATDRRRTPPRRLPSEGPPPPGSSLDGAVHRSSPSPSPTPERQRVVPVRPAPPGPGRLALIAAGVLLAVALAWAVIMTLIRMLRRRRRRAGTPRARIIGAWRECLDRFAEAAMWFQPSQTPTEIAAAATAAPYRGVPAAPQLATLVTSALFAPAEPSVEDADRAWRLERRILAELWPGPSRARRLLSIFDPRLLWRSWW